MKATLQKIGTALNKRMGIIKALFVFSVLLFVITEVGKIAKEVSGAQLANALASQSWWHLLSMVVIGIIAVTPMLTYDVMITKFLPNHYSLGYILKAGWITNTFTNIGGFGGVLGASLRANFYNREATKKQIVFAISKIALFLVSGLSLYCMISLVLVYGFGIGNMYGSYWIWLVGGALYFPAIFIFTRVNDSEFFDGLTLGNVVRLLSGSFGEWTGCVLFFLLIGNFMGLPIDFAAVVPLFVIASVVGEVSMVPGGIGSFDVFMIFGLGAVGVSRPDAVAWLLFYRLFYYIIPFAIGLVLFIHDTGHRLNVRLAGIPKQALQRVAQMVLTVFLYFSGFLMLLMSTVPNFAYNNKLFLQFYPYTFFFINQASSIIMAFLLIGVALGTAGRVKKAFWPTVIVLLIAILNTIRWLVVYDAISMKFVIFLIVILALVALSRHAYYRDRLAFSWGQTLWVSCVYVVTFILYTIVGVYNAPQIHHRHAVPEALFFPSQKLWLFGVIGLVLAAMILIIMYRYFASGYNARLRQTMDAARVKQVIETYGGNEISHLAYLNDKLAYYYQVDGVDQLIFLYQQKADKLIIMGEPFGNQAVLQAALEQLLDDADSDGCSLVFYEISEMLTMRLHEMGFDFIKTGEEGHVKLADFSLAGKRLRGERALMNKFTRDHYEFAILQPPFSADVMAELRAVSDSWLAGETEKGFSLGFFDEQYLNQAPVAVVYDPDHRIVAFANIMPQGNHQTTSIDLMRSSKSAPSGIMDTVFVHLFEQARDDGYAYFNMGMAPLSGVGVSRYSFIQEKIAHLIYEYGYQLYGFQGLRSYKEKYVTEWEPKYIAYRKRNSLIFTILQLLQVVNTRVHKSERHRPVWLLKRLK
ncbi:bifunctional lysylphosphatidylglycerol flippase/synthetase MprF [Lactiplantibacillus plantarum]|uniref:bifunctional lysylphosphatidylglycerol flippase/synthetase MprF n=1 Tax=Lactiplantibacillus plantarum TaxID=1590 RepID=UPI0028683F29|nr:bifunctional lysylphosphatidylglycerol flippase/synthetase MprF [Lactiplantibacillus plantarum]WMX72723.1 bifunctional lysylphosphatidylglycerol flippase/synthetase MprF [Lactiplantibacillus plantarum]